MTVRDRGYEAPVSRLGESCIPGISVRGSTEKGGREGGGDIR